MSADKTPKHISPAIGNREDSPELPNGRGRQLAGAFRWGKRLAQTAKAYIKPHSIYAFLGRKQGEQSESDESRLYAPLSPVSTVPAEKVEMQVLKKAFANRREERIYNIGITGPYGSGKSSLIQSFLKHNPIVKPIMVSLANFRIGKEAEKVKMRKPDSDKGNQNDGNTNEETKLKELEPTQLHLETEILQQILYSVDGDQLPSSRFHRIPKYSLAQESIVATVLALGFGIAGVWGSELIWKTLLNTEIPHIGRWVVFILSTLSAFQLAKTLSRQAQRLFGTIGKVRLSQVEVSLEEATKASMLNEAIDEIIHYFEQTGSNCLVIEDLDRYGSVDLFTSLRELSDILRRSPRTRHLGIVFLYAVKDELFKDETRTKFFDLIIPIKPHTSKYNSHEIFSRLNEEMALGISSEAILDLSTFVESNRVVLSICNELRVANGAGEYAHDSDKLFALTIYKNLFPADYAELLQGRGAVPKLFAQLDEIKEKQIRELNEEVADIEKNLIPIQAFQPVNETLLMADYVARFLIQFTPTGSYQQFTIDGRRLINNDSTEAFFDKIKQAERVNGNKFDFQTWQESVNEKSYTDRRAIIEGEGQQLLQEHRQRIKRIAQKIEMIRSGSPAVILGYLPELATTGKQTAEQFARILIRNAYIENDFTTYVVARNKGHFTQADHAFLLAVKRNNLVDRVAEIQVGKVFNALKVNYFKRPNILQYQIVFHAASNPLNERSQELLKVLEPNLVGTREVVSRALDHFRAEHNVATLLGWLLQADVAHAEYLSQRVNDSEVQAHLIRELQSTTSEDIGDKVLPLTRHFVEGQSQFITTAQNAQDAVQAAIALKVKWERQNLSGLNEDIIAFLRDSDLIEISRDNLKQYAQLETAGNYTHYENVVKALVEGKLNTTLTYAKRHVAWFFTDLVKNPPHEHTVPRNSYIMMANWPTPPSLANSQHILQLLPEASIHPEELEGQRWQAAVEGDKFIRDWITADTLLEGDEDFDHIATWLNKPDVYNDLSSLDEFWGISLDDATALIEGDGVSSEALIALIHLFPKLDTYSPQTVSPEVFIALARAQKLPLSEVVLDWAEANTPMAGRYLLAEDVIIEPEILEGLLNRPKLTIDALRKGERHDHIYGQLFNYWAENNLDLPEDIVVLALRKSCEAQFLTLTPETVAYLISRGDGQTWLAAFIAIQIVRDYEAKLEEIQQLPGYDIIGPGRGWGARLPHTDENEIILNYLDERNLISSFKPIKSNTKYEVRNKDPRGKKN